MGTASALLPRIQPSHAAHMQPSHATNGNALHLNHGTQMNHEAHPRTHAPQWVATHAHLPDLASYFLQTFPANIPQRAATCTHLPDVAVEFAHGSAPAATCDQFPDMELDHAAQMRRNVADVVERDVFGDLQGSGGGGARENRDSGYINLSRSQAGRGGVDDWDRGGVDLWEGEEGLD